MTPELINGLAQGGATALLLGVVLLVLVPRILHGLEKSGKRFSIEMRSERDAHRDEVKMIAASLEGLRKATDNQTHRLSLELQRQTVILEHVGRHLSDDLPDVRAMIRTNPGYKIESAIVVDTEDVEDAEDDEETNT